ALAASRLPPPPTRTLVPYTTLFRSPLATTPSPWAFSGGEQVVPVIDLIAPDQETQDAALKSGILPLPAVAAGDAGLLWLLLMALDRKSTRLNSSHVKISYAVFCLKK